MYTNGINTYNKLHDEKPQMTSNNFNFEGDSFSELMDKEEAAGKGMRETAQELAEDESILSTDEENRTIAKRNQDNAKQAESQKTNQPEIEADKARLLKLMDMSNKINMSSINISKSKKELENTVGSAIEDDDEPEDITSVVAKLAAMKEGGSTVEHSDVETDIGTDKHPEDFEEDRRKDNSQVLYETEEELKEDLSILSTEEENLEMARRNSVMNRLSDDDYKTTQDDMMFLNDIIALNNQMNISKEMVENTQSVLSALMSQTKDSANRMSLMELNEADINFIIDLFKMGSFFSSTLTDEKNKELLILSEKFLFLLRDSIVNNKIFRIDFDNQISVIIKISTDGTIKAEFLTNDDAIETYLKNNLHVLKEKFDELNVKYEDVSYKNTNKEN